MLISDALGAAGLTAALYSLNTMTRRAPMQARLSRQLSFAAHADAWD
jgi:hypothetical protein